MASVEKYYIADGSPRWRVRYRINYCGKQVQKKKAGFQSERDANRWRAKIEMELDSKDYIPVSTRTLSQYLSDYLQLYCSDLAPKTITAYRAIATKLSRTSLGQMPLQSISPEDITITLHMLMEGSLDGKPLSANTIRHYFILLNLVFKQALLNRRISFNPCSAVKLPRVAKYHHHILDVAQYQQLLQANRGLPIYIPLVLGGYMGLRKGEVLGLTWPDIDFKKNTLTVRQIRQKVEGQEILREPKTEKSRRTLVMPQFVAEELRVHRDNIIIGLSHQLVCCLTTGEPLSYDTFYQRVKRALKRAGLPAEIRFHDLRHTCAALLVLADASPKEVSEYLGHANAAFTMDIYADIFDKQKEATAQKLDRLLRIKQSV